MQYLKNLFGSFTSPATYQQFMAGPTRRALGHFALSMLLISALQGFVLVRQWYPQLVSGLQENADALMAAYPADLTISWDGQQLTTDPAKYHLLVMDPSLLPLFQETPGATSETLVYMNADVTTQEALEAMTSYRASAVVDQHSLFYTTPETGLNEEALGEYLGDRHFELKREMLPVLRNTAVEGVSRFQPTALWLGPLLLALFVLIAQFFTSLVFATLLFLPAKLLGAVESWAQSWRLTLVLLVVVQLITVLTGWLYPATTFPVHTAAFWLLAAFILVALRLGAKPTVAAPKISKKKAGT